MPCNGLPATIGLDNGPVFIAMVLQELAKQLEVTWNLHTVYWPQSLGKVERMNQMLKETLAKFYQETGVPWLDLLPLALFRVCNDPNATW